MTRTDAVEAFIDAQRADFTRTQVERMALKAEQTGTSDDYGDGYLITCTDGRFSVQVARRWL